jgi:hypothetical protein
MYTSADLWMVISIYIYIYIYICMYMYVCLCIYSYIYYSCTFIHTKECIYASTKYTSVAYIHVFKCRSLYCDQNHICLHACMCMYLYVCTHHHIPTRLDTYMHTYSAYFWIVIKTAIIHVYSYIQMNAYMHPQGTHLLYIYIHTC